MLGPPPIPKSLTDVPSYPIQRIAERTRTRPHRCHGNIKDN